MKGFTTADELAKGQKELIDDDDIIEADEEDIVGRKFFDPTIIHQNNGNKSDPFSPHPTNAAKTATAMTNAVMHPLLQL